MDGWIKMHRKFIDWEWYHDIPCKILALHYILSANYEDKKMKGLIIKRGQMIVGLNSLSNEIGLSKQQIRTAHKKLVECGFCNIEPTNRFSIVTICNYDNYQSNYNDVQHTDNTQSTYNQHTEQHSNNNNIRNKEKRSKERKKIKESPNGDEKKTVFSFDLFWDNYHKITQLSKTDFQAAKKKWDALKDPERKLAIENIQAYWDSLNDKKYCKKARTYLGDKNFNDEFRQDKALTAGDRANLMLNKLKSNSNG